MNAKMVNQVNTMKKQHYCIKGWNIFNIDELEISHGFYIREILDTCSSEYKLSKLTAKQKKIIILDLGLEKLTKVLDDCYRSNHKPYKAVDEAKDACKLLRRQDVIF